MKKVTTVRDLVRMLSKYKDQDAPIALFIDTEEGDESLHTTWPVIKTRKDGKRVVISGVETDGEECGSCKGPYVHNDVCVVCGDDYSEEGMVGHDNDRPYHRRSHQRDQEAERVIMSKREEIKYESHPRRRSSQGSR